MPKRSADPEITVALVMAPRDEGAFSRAEAKAALHLRLRARGIQDLAVLRALEMVPREAFVSHRYVDLAARDLALPIGCGQTISEPSLVARMIEALTVARHHRVLEIGTGSGFAAAVLAQLAQEVFSLERFRSLAIESQERLAQLGVVNAAVVHGDGLAVPATIGQFDRIIVHGVLGEVPGTLAECLAADGVIVFARQLVDAPACKQIVRLASNGEDGFTETPICPCRLQAILPGLAEAL